jgi:hypothetical protein
MVCGFAESHWPQIWERLKPLILESIANGTLEKDLKKLLDIGAGLLPPSAVPKATLGDLATFLGPILLDEVFQPVPTPDLAARPDKRGGR